MKVKKLAMLALLLAVLFQRDEIKKRTISSEDYKFITYDSYMTLIQNIKDSNLNDVIFRVTDDGFEKYRITPVPYCTSFGQKMKCKNPIIEIASFSKGEEFVSGLPTVMLVAGFHGDEVVGTNTLYYLIDLVTKNYQKDPFFAQLLDNVHLMILPMANVNGFNGLHREEVSVIEGREVSNDPNRDFPYDPMPADNCFKTSTALLIDAIYRKNLIIGCITFHGGDNSITYPWGNFKHESDQFTGDNVAFASISSMLKSVAGNNPKLGVQEYKTGTIQDVVYNVHGGFEDWAYGASFDAANINRNCGIYDNQKVGLYKNKIGYDTLTNRAFVYLIEAGHSKIPDERTLGNDVPLKSNDYTIGKWGHVTRNINICLRFAQTMRPFALIDDVSYSGVLSVKVQVFGCLSIDSVASNNGPITVVSSDYDTKRNIWFMVLEIALPAGSIKSIGFDVKCDSNFAQRSGSNYPQSHLVKLRTTPDFHIEKNGKKLSSNTSINVKLVNIRTDLLTKGVINWFPNNINVISYSQRLVGSVNDFRRQTEEQVIIEYKAGKAWAKSVMAHTETSPKEMRVRLYGGQNKSFSTTTDRHLISFNTVEPREIDLQSFLSLAGRDIDVYELDSNNPVYTNTLTLEKVEGESDSLSWLMIPPNGVNCRSPDYNSGLFFVRVTKNGKTLNIEFSSEANEYYVFKLGTFAGDLMLAGSYKFGDQLLFTYTNSQQSDEIDDFRLLLGTFEVFLSGNRIAFSCILVQGDPVFRTPTQLTSVNHVALTSLKTKKGNGFKLFVILISVILFMVTIYCLAKKYQERRNYGFHGSGRDIELPKI